jgi:hypothetical protein
MGARLLRCTRNDDWGLRCNLIGLCLKSPERYRGGFILSVAGGTMIAVASPKAGGCHHCGTHSDRKQDPDLAKPGNEQGG